MNDLLTTIYVVSLETNQTLFVIEVPETYVDETIAQLLTENDNVRVYA